MSDVEAYCSLCRFRSIVPPEGGPCMGCGRWVQKRDKKLDLDTSGGEK